MKTTLGKNNFGLSPTWTYIYGDADVGERQFPRVAVHVVPRLQGCWDHGR